MNIVGTWIMKVGVLCAFVVGIYFFHGVAVNLQGEVEKKYGELLYLPQRLIHASLLQVELDEYASDVEKIQGYVVGSEELIDVVADIESEGERHGVSIHVSDLQKELVIDEKSGRLTEPPGPFIDVRVTIEISGDPENIVTLLHGIENLPYLLQIVSFSVNVDTLSTSGAVFVGNAPSESEEVQEPVYGASGEAEVFVTTLKSE